MQNFNQIVAEMKANLKEPANKMEGGFSSDVLQSVGLEIHDMVQWQNYIHNQHWVDTAEGEFLDKKAMDYGLVRKKATKAYGKVTITGQKGTIVPEDFIVGSDSVRYRLTSDAVIGSNGSVDVTVEAIEPGTVGNVPAQTIYTLVSEWVGLNKPDVENKEPIETGTDEETDDSLRSRLIFKIQSPATSGNKYQYKQWAESVVGVGRAKVFPLHKGPGTVKVLIVDANGNAPDHILIDKVKKYIADDNTGEGVAPIGATLSVESPKQKNITVKVRVTLIDGGDLEGVKGRLKLRIQDFFKENALIAKNVSIPRINDIVFDDPEVDDVVNLTINDQSQNIQLKDDEIAKLIDVVVTR